VRAASAGNNGRMLKVFEVFVASGSNPDELLSEEVLKETQAQVMTVDEAKAVGFSGLAPDPKGRERRLIAVAERDAQFIQRRLEAHGGVASFRVHDVDD
jgi:hypothetical protein